MSIEEQIQEQNEFNRYKQEVYNRLTLLDKDMPLTKLELLKIGSVPYRVENMEFLIVKVNDVYFDFLNINGRYYKW